MKLTEGEKNALKRYLTHLKKSGGHRTIIAALEKILDESLDESQRSKAFKIILPLISPLQKVEGQHGSEALFFLGICYSYGLGVKRDNKQALALYNLAAEQGYDCAQLYLGEYYQWGGGGLAKDLKKAAEFYLLAAKQGNVKAQCHIGRLYRDGEGVIKDEQKAFEFFRQAAEAGDAEGQDALARCYCEGIGVEKNETRAAELYRLSADQGDDNSQYNLGVCYTLGFGLPKDEKLAFKYFDLAASQGHIKATFEVGQHFFNGSCLPKDVRRAVEFYTIAAAHGHGEAQHELAFCYQRGQGVDPDDSRKILLARSAAKHLESLSIVFHEQNKDIIEAEYPPLGKAVAHYTELTKKDDVSALTTLAFCFQMGLGCKQDLDKAIEYYRLASSKGASCAWDLYICYQQKARQSGDSKQLIEFCNSLIRSVNEPISPGDSKRAAELEVKREQEQQTANDIRQEQALVLAYAYEYGLAGLKQDLYVALTNYIQARNIDALYVTEKISYYSSLLKIITLDWGGKNNFNRFLRHLERNNGHNLVINAIKAIVSELQPQESFKKVISDIQTVENVNSQHRSETICFMAYCYGHGVGVEQDKKQSIKLFKLAADQKYAWSQYLLSSFFDEGHCVPQNKERAKELLLAASEQGLAEAQFKLGSWYQSMGDKEQATKLFIKSSAYFALGYLYGTREEVAQDEKRAAECYALALAQNEPEMQVGLGDLYYLGGRWVIQDVKRAAKLYALAAEQGFAYGQISLGTCYLYGRGVMKNERKAASFFALAAAQNHAEAQWFLGNCYRDGNGLEEDKKQAAKLFSLAAKQGYVHAERLLGECYEQGSGVIKDVKKAMELYTMAAAKSDVEALRKLADFYAKGAERHMLLTQTLAEKGDETARAYITSIFSLPECQYPTLEKAVAHYSSQASDQDLDAKDLSDPIIKDHSALITLAFCYQMGLGCNQNISKAIKYYSQAFDNGAACAWDLLQCYSLSPVGYPKNLLDFCTKLEASVKAFQPLEDASKSGDSKEDMSKEDASQGDVKEDHEQKKWQDTTDIQEEHALALAYAFEHGKLGLEKKLFSALRCYQKANRDDHVQGKILYYQPLVALRTKIQEVCPSLTLPKTDIAEIIAEYAYEEPKL